MQHTPDPLLAALGERLRLARRRRHRTAQDVAAQAGITRVTLRRVEAGEPTVMIGTYVKVMATLDLAQDLVLVARDDHQGRRLQDEALRPRAAGTPPPTQPHTQPRAEAPAHIRLADYPVLREIAWNTDPHAVLTPAEAFALYERHWRHLDPASMKPRERKLVARLTASVGKGVMLV